MTVMRKMTALLENAWTYTLSSEVKFKKISDWKKKNHGACLNTIKHDKKNPLYLYPVSRKKRVQKACFFFSKLVNLPLTALHRNLVETFEDQMLAQGEAHSEHDPSQPPTVFFSGKICWDNRPPWLDPPTPTQIETLRLALCRTAQITQNS